MNAIRCSLMHFRNYCKIIVCKHNLICYHFSFLVENEKPKEMEQFFKHLRKNLVRFSQTRSFSIFFCTLKFFAYLNVEYL